MTFIWDVWFCPYFRLNLESAILQGVIDFGFISELPQSLEVLVLGFGIVICEMDQNSSQVRACLDLEHLLQTHLQRK